MAAAVAPPPQTETAPVAALWDELCAAPQPPAPKRVVICGSTTRLVELARARAAHVREDRVEVLLDEEAEGRHHGDAAVGELRLAEHVELLLGLRREVERVEEAERRRD